MRSTIILLFLAVICSCSPERPAIPAVGTVSISIPSVQCSMCDKTITTALMGTSGVDTASVDLESKTVSVTFVNASITLSDLESVITKAGYDANDKKADPEAYENLSACCKLPDDADAMDSM